MNRQICGECRHHHMETRKYPDKRGRITASIQVKSGWVCANPESDYYTDWTSYDDGCDCFEQRGIETVDLRKETVREEDWEW